VEHLWIVLSVGFGFFVWFRYGGEQGLEYFAGYLLEKSLSSTTSSCSCSCSAASPFQPQFQHRVLFWGVLGAIVLRGTLILRGRRAGATLPLDHRRLRGDPRLYRPGRFLFHKERRRNLPTTP